MEDKLIKTTRLIMYLILLHSFIVGILLIFLPSRTMEIFGFQNYPDNFFRAQGGIFHIVLCYAYFLGGYHPVKYIYLLRFSFIAKFMGFSFLMIYYLAIRHNTVIFLSGTGDLFMGLIIFLLYQKLINKTN